MSRRIKDATHDLVELLELRERATRALDDSRFVNEVVASRERPLLPGIVEALDDDIEDAWLELATLLKKEGFPTQASQMVDTHASHALHREAAQAQADASGHRVRYSIGDRSFSVSPIPKPDDE